MLHITRLTDPVKYRDKERLTLLSLPKLVDKDIRQAVAEAVQKAVERAGFCRDWRNRHIAHRDLELAIKEGANPLAPSSRADIREALSAITNVMNIVQRYYAGSELKFVIGRPSSAEDLLLALDQGLMARQKWREQIERGEVPKDPIRRRDL